MKLLRTLALPIACALAPAAAMAQSANYFDRNNNVGVLDRSRPDYQALGIDEGGFYIFPSLTVAPEYDDNIFATSNDRVGDLIVAVAPRVQVKSNWSRDEVAFSAQSTSDIYAVHSGESTTDYSISGSGRLDIEDASSLSLKLSYGRSTIPRTSEISIADTNQPVQYDSGSASVSGVQTLNRVRFTENLNFNRTVYENQQQTSTGPVSLGYFDNDIETATLRTDYALNPEFSVYVTGTLNNRGYDQKPPQVALNRDSSGYEMLAGASLDITRLARGEIGVGYLQQDYQSSVFHTVSGPAVHGKVEYFLSGVTTIAVGIDRNVIDADDPQAVSFVQTDGSLNIDHELLRNVIVSARVSYETDDFTGVKRNDGRANFSVSGTYLLNRHASIHLGYSSLDLTSIGAERINDYDVNVVSLSLVLQL